MKVDFTRFFNLGNIKVGDVAQGGTIHLTLWKVNEGKATFQYDANGVPSKIALGITGQLERPPMEDKNGIYFAITEQDKTYLKDFNFGIGGEEVLKQLDKYFKVK